MDFTDEDLKDIAFLEFVDHHIDEETKAIYFIEIDDKGYVGQTKDTKKRFSNHSSNKSRCSYIRNAIQKHGIENATIRILERELSFEDANVMEAFYIEILGTLAPKGYNLTIGGDSQMWSPAMLEVFRSPEMREHRRKLSTELWERPEHREKMKIVLNTDEYKKKASDRSKALWAIDEYKKKAIKNTKTLWATDDYRNKQMITRAMEEFRQGQSNGTKKQWEDPVMRQNKTDGIRKSRGNIVRNFMLARGAEMREFVELYEKYNGKRKDIIREANISLSEYKRRRNQMEAMYFL
ncbi:GIY-YIG catalytic domain-containing endonuclease [Paramecium bursaria Chlorella virus NE-JV-1]|nr:GIY-YIG catalytic domain-containing endonuclease [Paramecium bursaria Chlorella virus NE-JV-1]